METKNINVITISGIGPRTSDILGKLHEDAELKTLLSGFENNKVRSGQLTREKGIRTAVYQDVTSAQLGPDHKAILNDAGVNMSGRNNQSQVFFDEKGDIKSKDDDQRTLQNILIYYNDEGGIFRVSFHNPTLSDEQLKDITEKQGFSRSELRALSIIAMYNNEMEGHEFNVSYSNNKDTMDSLFVGELKQAVPEFFNRSFS